MKTVTYLIGVIGAIVIAVLGLGWLGLQVRPRSFPAYPEATPDLERVPLPAGLPAPVARYYQVIAGEQVPRLTSAVITTRGRLRFAGITFPARLRFIHDAGQGYRHYIEATIFGYPLMKVNERYLDGRGRMELPMGVIENEPKVNMAANLGLWGESIWLPTIFVTDPRVCWEAIDDTTARLVVPCGAKEDTFTVSFDPETGLIAWMEAMRYRDATDTEKIPWRLEPLAWSEYHGLLIPSSAAVTWADEGTPWLVLEIEEIAYNVDVAAYIRTTGS